MGKHSWQLVKATIREDLAELYRGYRNEHLLERLWSGEMVELAETVATAELLGRGIASFHPKHRETVNNPGVERAFQFVTVANSLNSMELEILRARLEAEGIPVHLADINMSQAYSVVAIAIGGARLQVPSEYYEEASQLIAAINSGVLAASDQDNEDRD